MKNLVKVLLCIVLFPLLLLLLLFIVPFMALFLFLYSFFASRSVRGPLVNMNVRVGGRRPDRGAASAAAGTDTVCDVDCKVLNTTVVDAQESSDSHE